MGADDETAPAAAHGVDGICDQVVEDLSDVVFEAKYRSARLVGGLYLDVRVGEPAVIEIEDGIDEIRCVDLCGAHGLTMEAEGLRGDLTDAGEFGLRGVEILACVFGQN